MKKLLFLLLVPLLGYSQIAYRINYIVKGPIQDSTITTIIRGPLMQVFDESRILPDFDKVLNVLQENMFSKKKTTIEMVKELLYQYEVVMSDGTIQIVEAATELEAKNVDVSIVTRYKPKTVKGKK